MIVSYLWKIWWPSWLRNKKVTFKGGLEEELYENFDYKLDGDEILYGEIEQGSLREVYGLKAILITNL